MGAFGRTTDIYYNTGIVLHDNIRDWQDFEEAYCIMGHSRSPLKLTEFSYIAYPDVPNLFTLKVKFSDESMVRFTINPGLTQDKDEFSIVTMNQLLLPQASEELITLRKRFMRLVHFHDITFFRRIDKYI